MTPEYINALAALVTATAWPAIVIMVLCLHRKSVARFLENLESLTLPGGFSAKLRSAVDREARAIMEGDPHAAQAVTQDQIVAAERVVQLAQRQDPSVARQQMRVLAREYERVRAAMPPGTARTRQMETIVTKMRTLALACQSFLQEFAASSWPGERLAAIAILQLTPNSDYLDWLAQRLQDEAPFVGYHAAVALLGAVRGAQPAQRDLLRQAVLKAKDALDTQQQATDRGRVLDDALGELGESSA